MNIRQPEVTALVAVRQSFVVEAHAVQNRGVQIVNVYGIFDNVVAVIIGLTERRSGLDATASQPH